MLRLAKNIVYLDGAKMLQVVLGGGSSLHGSINNLAVVFEAYSIEYKQTDIE